MSGIGGGQVSDDAGSTAGVAMVDRQAWGRTIHATEEIESLRPDGIGNFEPMLSTVRIAVGVLSTFALVVVLSLVMAAIVPSAFGYGSTAVVSGSMEPLIGVGDVVVTRDAGEAPLQAGQVVDYRFENGRRLHRIVSLLDGGYQTAGDANASPDSTLVTPEQIEGVGHLLVPYAGLPQVWIRDGRWLPLIASIMVISLAAWTARPRWMEAELR